jgi:uncharacterized OB-fold protein
MKCADCGAKDYKPSSRSDICTDCFQLRLEFIRARKRGEVSREQFAAVQRTMATDVFRNGRAARKMRKALDSEENYRG